MLPSTNEQAAHLKRVSLRIDALIVAFLRDRLRVKRPEFHMYELTAWVARHARSVAPDSAGRILRDLKSKGRALYVLVRRRASLYRVTYVEAA